MPDPSSQFDGASETTEVVGTTGVAQLRRVWAASNPKAHVLVLHGVAEHSGRYEHVGASWVKAGFSARSFDHVGHGRSGGKRGHVDSFDVFLDDIEANLTDLRTNGLPVVLMAHSLGGLMALAYCESDRPAPDVLLLSGPALGVDLKTWRRVGAPVLGRAIPTLFVKAEFHGDLLSTDPDVGARYEADPLRVHGQTAGLGKAVLGAMKTTNANLSKISIPTMVVHGGMDRIVPAHFSEPVGDLPVATRRELPGLAHEVLNEPSWRETMQSYVNFTNGALGLTPEG